LGRIEIIWGLLVILFGFIGLVRGFLRELGVTTALLIVLFAFDRWGERVVDYILKGLSMAGVSSTGEPGESAVRASVYIFLTILATFASYHGETLAFQGTRLRGAFGTFLSLLIGLINGYLVVGTIWFYLHKFGYPLGLVSEPLSPVAQELVKVLPMTVLVPFLPFLAVFMVIIRVIR